MEEGRLIRTDETFSKFVWEINLSKQRVEKYCAMPSVRDLRNKIVMVEEKIYIMGVS